MPHTVRVVAAGGATVQHITDGRAKPLIQLHFAASSRDPVNISRAGVVTVVTPVMVTSA